MATINSVTMIGRVVRDLQLEEIKPGMTKATITIATEYVPKSKDGQDKKEVCFINTTVWGFTAERCVEYLKKGSTIAVEGRLKLEKWTDKDGKERTKHVIVAENVVFLDPKTSAANLAGGQPAAPVSAPRPARPAYVAQPEEFDDSLPF